jgi:hypothetical protein
VSKTKPGKVPVLSKAERRKRQLAGLRPAKKGEVRNPLGKNGRERSDYVVGILSEMDRGQPLIWHVVKAQIRRARKGSDAAAKTLIEHFKGRAKVEVDLISSDRSMSPNRKPTTAEARQELDRVLAAIEKTAGVASADAAPEETAGTSEASATEMKAQP